MTKLDFDIIGAAEKMLKKGDYISALHYYFLERNTGNKAVYKNIADTYGAMGILTEAIKYYLKAYAEDKEDEEALNGLIYCYKDIDEEASYYYLNMAMRLVGEHDYEEYDDEDEELDDVLLKQMSDSKKPLTVHDKRDQSDLLEEAYQMIEDGDHKAAKKILDQIDPESYQYSDALLALASIEPKADSPKTIKLVERSLEVNPKSVKAHLFRIVYYAHKKNADKLESSLGALESLDLTDADDLTKAALCLCNFNRYESSEKFIMRKLKMTPYDKIMLLCLSSVNYAKGDIQGALKVANKVSSIYPDDIETKEMILRIMSMEGANLPEEMIKQKQEWTQYIKNLFLDDSNDITSPESIMKIKWLLQNDDDVYLQSAVCAFITGMPEYEEIVNDLLIDPFTQIIVKKQVLLRRICDPKIKTVDYVVSNLFRTVKIRHPRVPSNLKFAYYYVFIALAITEVHFESILDRSFKKLSDKYKACTDEAKKDLPINALAAILYYFLMDITEPLSCSLFECDIEDFNKAAKMLNIEGIEDV